MREKKEAQQLVRALRSQGLSYREILARVRVSKSSVSLWCRDVELEPHQNQVLQERKLIAGHQGLEKIAALRTAGRLKRRPSQRRKKPDIAVTNGSELDKIRKLYEVERLSVREVAAKSGMSFWHVYELMRDHGVTRRRGSEQNYATYESTKPRFTPLASLTATDETLRAVGAILYRAEGTKRGHVVDFTNSDPLLIRLFMSFLRQICGIAESRIRILLYCYADQDIEELKSFWSGVTRVPSEQFTKPFVRSLTPNVSRRKMRWGLIHVRYADKRLLNLILQWSEQYAKTWAGT